MSAWWIAAVPAMLVGAFLFLLGCGAVKYSITSPSGGVSDLSIGLVMCLGSSALITAAVWVMQ